MQQYRQYELFTGVFYGLVHANGVELKASTLS